MRQGIDQNRRIAKAQETYCEMLKTFGARGLPVTRDLLRR